MLLLFRHAALKDAEACAEIYRPYVEKTSVTFEYTPPDKTEIARRMDCYTPTFPWIVAQAGEKVIGYACDTCNSQLNTNVVLSWQHIRDCPCMVTLT